MRHAKQYYNDAGAYRERVLKKIKKSACFNPQPNRYCQIHVDRNIWIVPG